MQMIGQPNAIDSYKGIKQRADQFSNSLLDTVPHHYHICKVKIEKKSGGTSVNPPDTKKLS